MGAALTNGLRVIGRSRKKTNWCAPVQVRRRWPASTCWWRWAYAAKTSGCRTSPAWSGEGRTELMDDNKARYAQKTDLRTVDQLLDGADVFLGLSAAKGAQTRVAGQDGQEPADHGAGEPGAGDHAGPRQGRASRRHHRDRRSDYPNQVNNVLCFPFIFRGALTLARPP